MFHLAPHPPWPTTLDADAMAGEPPTTPHDPAAVRQRHAQTRLSGTHGGCAVCRMDIYDAYVIAPEDALELTALLEASPRLLAVLREVLTPLEQCFGRWPRALRLRHDGDGEPLLCLTLHLPAGRARFAEAAYDRLAATWWLATCHRTEGLLVIDYALEDAP